MSIFLPACVCPAGGAVPHPQISYPSSSYQNRATSTGERHNLPVKSARSRSLLPESDKAGKIKQCVKQRLSCGQLLGRKGTKWFIISIIWTIIWTPTHSVPCDATATQMEQDDGHLAGLLSELESTDEIWSTLCWVDLMIPKMYLCSIYHCLTHSNLHRWLKWFPCNWLQLSIATGQQKPCPWPDTTSGDCEDTTYIEPSNPVEMGTWLGFVVVWYRSGF